MKNQYSLIMMICLMFLSGCGQKGNLYIPTKAQQEEQEAKKARIETKKQLKLYGYDLKDE